MEDLEKKLTAWRRDFHRHPEQGFLEMRTASIVAQTLTDLGYPIQIGKDVMKTDAVMGRPDEATISSHKSWAIEHGAVKTFLPQLEEGYTGIVATLDTEKEGPTIAFRFDMDALPILESDDAKHAPEALGFRSINNGSMHACGHDAHTSIGLGLATMLMQEKDSLRGKIKLIFQPAEEGTRGAKSMVEKGVVDDVDFFIASHIGTGIPQHQFVAATDGFMATSKLNISFEGVQSHAGSHPHLGQNALLSAANATINMHAISRHPDGESRVNVGELHAGSGRNIIAGHAEMLVETRGETKEINNFIEEKVRQVAEGAAVMYGTKHAVDKVGEGINIKCSLDLAQTLKATADNHAYINDSVLNSNHSAGSEDATFFIDRVQSLGGQATYSIFGTELAAGHHNKAFDINESTLLPAVEILYKSIAKILDKA